MVLDFQSRQLNTEQSTLQIIHIASGAECIETQSRLDGSGGVVSDIIIIHF